MLVLGPCQSSFLNCMPFNILVFMIKGFYQLLNEFFRLRGMSLPQRLRVKISLFFNCGFSSFVFVTNTSQHAIWAQYNQLFTGISNLPESVSGIMLRQCSTDHISNCTCTLEKFFCFDSFHSHLLDITEENHHFSCSSQYLSTDPYIPNCAYSQGSITN